MRVSCKAASTTVAAVAAAAAGLRCAVQTHAVRHAQRCHGTTTSHTNSSTHAASAASPSSSASSSAAAAMTVVPYAVRVQRFREDMHDKGVALAGVDVRPDEAAQCRGLYATCACSANTTLLSAPLRTATLSATTLLRGSAFVRALRPPSLDVVCQYMRSRSISDPVLYDYVHLALLLAAERVNPHSAFAAYFDVLPHPAVDDAAVIAAHKDTVEPLVLVEWDDYQREMLTIVRGLLRRWHGNVAGHTRRTSRRQGADDKAGDDDDDASADVLDASAVPPEEVVYWSLRTVLCRSHLLPNSDAYAVGAALPYMAWAAVERSEDEVRWWRRVRRVLRGVLGSPTERERARLVPTLMPVLDMVAHAPSSNVRVEVGTQSALCTGGCVSLQAMRALEPGEELCMRYNTSHSLAFLLYRFGFVPQ